MSDENLAENQPHETSLLTQVHLFESLDDTITDFHPKVVGRKSSAPEISTGKRVSFHHDRTTNESRRENIPTNRGDAQFKQSRTKSRYSKNGHKIAVRQTRAGSINQSESRAVGMSTKDMKNRSNMHPERNSLMKAAGRTVQTGASITVPSSSEADSSSSGLDVNRDTSDMHAQLDTNSQAVLSVISHLEHSLDEQRKQTLQLQAEIAMLREQQTKRETELRSSYDAELLRLQGMITRLHSTRSSTDQTTRQISPSRPSSNPSPRLPTAETVAHQPRSTSNTRETNNEIVQLQREIERQDELIAGYQRENERLYEEAKQCKKENQPSRELIETAERLTSENASLRIELERLEKESRQRAKRIEELLQMNHCQDQNSRLADLEQALATVNLQLKSALNERDAARLEFQNAHQQIHQLTVKHRQLTEQLECERNENRVEREKLQENHRETVGELQRKLQWYLENQSMVNRDQARLKAQLKEMNRLKEQLRQTQPQSTVKNISTPILKESDRILDEQCHNSDPMVLEHRIKSLEAELEQAQEHEKRAIRSIQQQYETVKHQYEERIKTLSEQQTVERYRSRRQSVEVQTTDSISDQSSAASMPQIWWRIPKTSDFEESQTIHHLLRKLRDQIGHLKHELANRQRAIDELQRLSSLNTSTGPEAQGSLGITRYTGANQTTSFRRSTRTNAPVSRVRPRQINTIPHRQPENQPIRSWENGHHLNDLQQNIAEMAVARIQLEVRFHAS
ncbi:hypothetical protein D915_007749 [Fasciola hepatica]|uniref:Centrosomal protein of 162 kDa n=1 Tax=Fasciola hepatica TaxID=6192 RepID=A0A4E0R7F6_FASHE|nr:hypothetical protein D915_007749 [Fasciola hepatica]